MSAYVHTDADAPEPLREIDTSEYATATNGAAPAVRQRAVDGATFIEDVPDHVPALWGDGDAVLWAQGEPLMLVGPDGVGKTSLAQQLVLARVGIRPQILGMDVAQTNSRVLYVAADRPRQAASSLRRMVAEADHRLLRDRLLVWRGPLEFNLTEHPASLREFVQSFDADTIVIDSLKDVAVDLTKDETGGRVSIAFQEVIASDIELLVLHHQRKEQQGANKPRRLTDVYGSRWLTAGMGSVVLLWGEPGDLVVEFRHLKQPAEEVGPFNVVHDHTAGRSAIHEHASLEDALANAPHGLTVSDAATQIFATTTPTRNEIEKARRRLETLVGRNLARRHDDPDGLARYFPLESGA